MHRKSPITHPVTLEKSTDTRNWQYNAELLVNTSTFAFFIYWLKKGAESVWSFAGLRYFFGPLAAIGALLAAIFSIRQAVLRQDAHSISSAVIEVLAAGATIVGAIAVISSIAALAVVGPLLLTASITLKTLYSLGAAIGFAIHSLVAKTPEMKAVYRTKSLEALVDGVLGAVISAAAITLLLVAAPVIQTVMASIAVAAAALTVVHFVVKAAKSADRLKAESEALKSKEFHESTHHHVHDTLGIKPEDRLLVSHHYELNSSSTSSAPLSAPPTNYTPPTQDSGDQQSFRPQ